MHGEIFPRSKRKQRNKYFSCSVTTYLNEQSADTNQFVFLLDNGIYSSSDPVVYYYNFEKTDTIHVYADVMNFMEYDAGTNGNHDIETGHDVYDKFNEE